MEIDVLTYSMPVNTVDISMTISLLSGRFTSDAEDHEDPGYLGDEELVGIEMSLKDYSERRFKRGSIEELLKDLKD